MKSKRYYEELDCEEIPEEELSFNEEEIESESDETVIDTEYLDYIDENGFLWDSDDIVETDDYSNILEFLEPPLTNSLNEYIELKTRRQLKTNCFIPANTNIHGHFYYLNLFHPDNQLIPEPINGYYSILAQILGEPLILSHIALADSGKLLMREMISVLETMAPREIQILASLYGIQDGRMKTREEVGRKFGYSRERIRQIVQKAFRKLRHPSRSRKLKQFLYEKNVIDCSGLEDKVYFDAMSAIISETDPLLRLCLPTNMLAFMQKKGIRTIKELMEYKYKLPIEIQEILYEIKKQTNAIKMLRPRFKLVLAEDTDTTS